MTRTRRSMAGKALSVYVAFVFLLAVAGPGLTVFGADSVVEPVSEAVVAPDEGVPAEEPVAEVVVEEADEPVVEAPVAEAKVSEEAAPVTVPAPKASVAPAAIVPASSVPPVTVPGNPSLDPGGHRIDPPVSDTYWYGSTWVTITVYDTEMGEVFDFESNTPLLKVVAKGGTLGANIYTYAAPGVYSDTGLHAPVNPSGKWADLSHIDIYFVPMSETGSITVVKFNDVDGDKKMGEEESELDGWMFTLTPAEGDAVSGTSGDDGSGMVVFDELEAGLYSIDETAKDGWHNTTVLPVEVELGAGEDVTIYVGNAEDPPEEFTKTFELTFSDAPLLSEFSVSFLLNDDPMSLPLTGPGPVYSAEIPVIDGDVIGSVSWWLSVDGSDYLLGITEGETINGDVTNSLDYDPAVGGHKFNDLNGDGVWDEGEPGLSGWTINLYRVMYSDPLPGIDPQAVAIDLYATTVTGPDGSYSFDQVLPGTYFVTETMQLGWAQTLAPEGEFDVSHATSIMDLDFGNHADEPPGDVTKTFELTYNGSVPEGVGFWVHYTLESDIQEVGPTAEGHWLELEGDGPFSASVDLPYGTTIVSVEWIAYYGFEQILLGTTSGETLTEDITNRFTYSGNASGHKFNDIDGNGEWDEGEPGMSGWTIYLYRMMPELELAVAPAPLPGFGLYASTVTGVGGSYSFSGVLPGTYYVAEEDREGWIMTVGPEGTFALVGQQPITGLDFGNTEEFLPFTDIDLAITKAADVTTSAPGATITYTLTYRNLGETEATDFTIVDDFDEEHVTVTDPAGGVVADGKITWTLAGPLSMEDGAQTITYKVKVDASMPAGTTNIDNVVVIDHPDDTNPENDTDDDRVTVTVADDPFLPFTGGEMLLLVSAAIASAATGLVLRRAKA